MWWFDVVMALLLAVFLPLGIKTGLLYNLLNVYLIGKCLLELAVVIYRAFQGQFTLSYWQEIINTQGYLYWLQLTIQLLFFATIAMYVLAVLPEDAFSPKEYQFFYWLTIGMACTIVLLLAIPQQNIIWPQLVVMVIFIGYMTKEHLVFYQSADPADLTLVNPFKTEATIVQGGASALYNHHYALDTQRWAVDMILPKNSKNIANRTALEDFACYGAELYAPKDGEVVRIIDGLPDMAIGDSDLKNLAGNYVVIKTHEQQYVMLAHLKSHSVAVVEGQQVVAGETLLALCGNSGNTTEPHLHMQIQDHPDFHGAKKTWRFNFIDSNGDLLPARAQTVID